MEGAEAQSNWAICLKLRSQLSGRTGISIHFPNSKTGTLSTKRWFPTFQKITRFVWVNPVYFESKLAKNIVLISNCLIGQPPWIAIDTLKSQGLSAI